MIRVTDTVALRVAIALLFFNAIPLLLFGVPTLFLFSMAGPVPLTMVVMGLLAIWSARRLETQSPPRTIGGVFWAIGAATIMGILLFGFWLSGEAFSLGAALAALQLAVAATILGCLLWHGIR